MKFLVYFKRIVFSYLYDVYYWLFSDFRGRASISGYKEYVSRKIYPDYLKKGAAVDGVLSLAQKYCKGKGLDIGAGLWPLAGARPIENLETENAYKLNESDKSIDFVFSSHLLEHLEEPEKAISEWSRVLVEEGILFLYIPHPSCQMWNKENLIWHKWNPTPIYMEDYFKNSNEFDLLHITYMPDAFFSFVVIARRKFAKK